MCDESPHEERTYTLAEIKSAMRKVATGIARDSYIFLRKHESESVGDEPRSVPFANLHDRANVTLCRHILSELVNS